MNLEQIQYFIAHFGDTSATRAAKRHDIVQAGEPVFR